MTDDLAGLFRAMLLVLTGAGLVTQLLTSKFSLWARLGIAVLPPLGLIVLGNWWVSLVIRPCNGDWSSARLAPAVALLHGYKLYQPPDRGPLNGWIYPPVSALCYLPAACLGDPTAMVLCGRLLSLLFYFGAVAWLMIREARSGRIPPVTAALLLVSFAFLTNETESLRCVSTEIIADTPALAFGTVALSLISMTQGASPGHRVAIAIGACTLAVWSKQLAAPLVLIPPLWTTFTGGWSEFRRCLLLFIAVVGGISLPILLAFGPRELFFNVIFIPSQHPWYPNALSRIHEVLLLGGLKVWTFKGFLALGLASMGVLLWSRFRDDQAKHRSALVWLPFVLAGLIEMPFAVVGTLKLGGGVNSLAHVFFYWTVAAALAFGGLLAKWPQAGWLLVALALLLGSVDQRRIASVLADRSSWGDEFIAGGKTWIEEQRTVVRYLKAHPGEAYFPVRPLEHLAVEGRLLHFEDGIYCRMLAGVPVSAEHFRQHIPPGLRLVCYPSSRSYGYPFYTVWLLSEFDKRVMIDELPGCRCYTRTWPGPSRASYSPGPPSSSPPMTP